MSIWRWADRFSKVPPLNRITLGEGNTPIVRSRRIGPAAGLEHLYFKLETSNPTGSYKDRFAAAAIADMLAQRKRRVVATSSGNTGAALAAYAAAAGMTCEIAIVETAPPGKLKQMFAYGAKLYMVRGFGLDAAVTAAMFEYLKTQGTRPDSAMQISAYSCSPVGMAGVQTIGYELVEQAPQMSAPFRHVFVPAGGGGLTLAVVRGVTQGATLAKSRAAAVHCVQPEGNDTIATPLRRGEAAGRVVKCTTTISGLQVPSVLDANAVIAECRNSGGTGHVVSDAEVYAMHKRLAVEEGIFSEPAGAVAAAAAVKAAQRGELRPTDAVVCLVTGSGFKDSTSLDRMIAGMACLLMSLDEVRAKAK